MKRYLFRTVLAACLAAVSGCRGFEPCESGIEPDRPSDSGLELGTDAGGFDAGLTTDAATDAQSMCHACTFLGAAPDGTSIWYCPDVCAAAGPGVASVTVTVDCKP